MIQKSIKILIIAVFSVLGFTAFTTLPAFADDNPNTCEQLRSQNAPQSVIDAAGCDNNTSDQLPTVIQNVINSVILVAGLIAVIFVVIGGISYMTSTGDPGKVKKAKDTILYACIGLVICVLAYAIVNWTINVIKQSDKPTSYIPTSSIS